jgi:hypothetical protein
MIVYPSVSQEPTEQDQQAKWLLAFRKTGFILEIEGCKGNLPPITFRSPSGGGCGVLNLR